MVVRVQTINKRINTMKLDVNHVLGELELKLKTFLEKNNIDAVVDADLNHVSIMTNKQIHPDFMDVLHTEYFLEFVEVQETYGPCDTLLSVYYVFEHKKIHKYQ